VEKELGHQVVMQSLALGSMKPVAWPTLQHKSLTQLPTASAGGDDEEEEAEAKGPVGTRD